MIRAAIVWLAKRLLAKYVSAALAGRIVDAASAAFDEIKAKGDDAVKVDGSAERPQISLRPHDAGAKPVQLDEMLSSDRQPNV
jgi:hypothetical protein